MISISKQDLSLLHVCKNTSPASKGFDARILAATACLDKFTSKYPTQVSISRVLGYDVRNTIDVHPLRCPMVRKSEYSSSPIP